MTMPGELMGRAPVAAIFRAPTADRFIDAADVLVDAGFQILEFTLTSAGAVEAITEARRRYPSDILIGAGTIRTGADARATMDAGADFLVSQVFDRSVARVAQERAVPFIPGALTPTEILTAWESGVPAVKVSPIGPVGGLRYLAELLGPMPDVPLFPTGGVLNDEVNSYLELGATIVGVSRDLFRESLAPGSDLDGLARRARAIIESIPLGAAA